MTGMSSFKFYNEEFIDKMQFLQRINDKSVLMSTLNILYSF